MWLAIFGMLLPSVSFGASPTTAVQDVALRANRSLHGRVVDLQGNARADLPVSIVQAGEVVGKATTDQNGQFVMADLKSGNYTLKAAEQLVHCRAWCHESAPPIAIEPMICTDPCAASMSGFGSMHGHVHGPLGGHAGPIAVNAVGGIGSAIGGLLSTPLGVAAVASAIAIPIAVGNDGDAS